MALTYVIVLPTHSDSNSLNLLNCELTFGKLVAPYYTKSINLQTYFWKVGGVIFLFLLYFNSWVLCHSVLPEKSKYYISVFQRNNFQDYVSYTYLS